MVYVQLHEFQPLCVLPSSGGGIAARGFGVLSERQPPRTVGAHLGAEVKSLGSPD